ncbi:MAG: hypothetical protein BWY70_00557 [Bacteroidetes bacterium ADurb.Bin408]|nr:MAG: hypothetical protein BWY70_00557 [Bacteroidetes bacterium ADurb.Bin408]
MKIIKLLFLLPLVCFFSIVFSQTSIHQFKTKTLTGEDFDMAGLKGANSTEFDSETPHPVIAWDM